MVREGEGRIRKGRESENKVKVKKKLKLCDYYSIYDQSNQPLSPTNTHIFIKINNHFQAVIVHKCVMLILIFIDFHKNYYFSQNANNNIIPRKI